MKKTFTLLFAIALIFKGICQIPNAGFENWADGNPVGWSTSNSQAFTPILQVSNSHSGGSAMKMQWQFNGMIGANVNCPDNSNPGIMKFPYAGRPVTLTGWYLSSFGSTDFLKVTCILYKTGNPIGFASKEIYGSTATYTQFALPFTYSVSGNADSASINLILLYSSSPDYSSFALVDDLAFSTSSTGLKEINSLDPTTLTVFSDPASGRTHINYEFGVGGPVSLLVRDLNGKVLKTLVNGYQSSGRYRLDENFDTFQEGIYMVEMETSQGTRTRKFCLTRN